MPTWIYRSSLLVYGRILLSELFDDLPADLRLPGAYVLPRFGGHVVAGRRACTHDRLVERRELICAWAREVVTRVMLRVGGVVVAGGRDGVSNFLKHILHKSTPVVLLAGRADAHVGRGHESVRVRHKASIKVSDGSANIAIEVDLPRRYRSTLPSCTKHFGLHISLGYVVLLYNLVCPNVLIRGACHSWRVFHVLGARARWSYSALHGLLHYLEPRYIRILFLHVHVAASTSTSWSVHNRRHTV